MLSWTGLFLIKGKEKQSNRNKETPSTWDLILSWLPRSQLTGLHLYLFITQWLFSLFFIMVLSLRVKWGSVERGLRICLHLFYFFLQGLMCVYLCELSGHGVDCLHGAVGLKGRGEEGSFKKSHSNIQDQRHFAQGDLQNPLPHSQKSLWLFCTAVPHSGLFLCTLSRIRAGEDGSAFDVWPHVPFQVLSQLYPHKRKCHVGVSGPAGHSLPSSAPLHSLSDTGSCCSSGRICPPHKTWKMRRDTERRKDKERGSLFNVR